ncbi:MAG TPA: hypothetical protein VGR28_06225 [Candidatus Thermoplasmatota archaeon]|jgi:hypothetical protein|nr:hypothetical protein [Candidatus Thermoplasmatota archaeon]
MPAVHVLKEFVVSMSNRPGALGESAGALGDAGINMRGFLATAPGGFPVLRFVTDDAAKAEAWLKASRLHFKIGEVVAVEGVDRPGEVGRLAKALAAAGVNVEAGYHAWGPANEVLIAFAVDDVGRARKALG